MHSGPLQILAVKVNTKIVRKVNLKPSTILTEKLHDWL